jgi:hypothetical protein
VDFLPLDFGGLQRPPVDSTKTPVPGSGGRHQPMPTTADQPVATSALQMPTDHRSASTAFWVGHLGNIAHHADSAEYSGSLMLGVRSH